MQEQHYQLQAQLARVEGEADTLQWQAAQAARDVAQLAGMVAASGIGGEAGAAGEPMEADSPGGQPAGSSGQGPRPAAAAQQQHGTAQPQASLDSSEAGSAVGSAAQEHNNSVGAFAAAADAAVAATADKDCHASSQLPEGVAAAALAEVLVPPEQSGPAGHPTMYGAPPPHEKFDELLARFQAQVGWQQWRLCCWRWAVGCVCRLQVYTLAVRCSPSMPMAAAHPAALPWPTAHAQVAKVKGFLDRHHLRTHDPAGEAALIYAAFQHLPWYTARHAIGETCPWCRRLRVF